MGRRKYKYKRYDEWEEREVEVTVKDDRTTAKEVKDRNGIKRLARSNGAVSDALWELELIEFAPNGDIAVNKAKTKEAAAWFSNQMTEARFYGQDEESRWIRKMAKDDNISERKARNRYARNEQHKALAIQAAARAGNVKITPHQRGIINQVADGDYYEVVWGKENKESGRRKFEKGTWRGKLGGRKGGGRTKDARARAKAQELWEARYGDRDKIRAKYRD